MERAPLGRVGRAHCCARPPSEPCERVSPHTPQASAAGSYANRSAGSLPLVALRRRWQWACMRRGLVSSDVPSSHMATVMVVLRVTASHCSHWSGLCGGSSAERSRLPQSGQRPSWALRSRRFLLRLGGGGALRRRSAQYSARVGSSGDALPLTIWCRTILVQENLRR